MYVQNAILEKYVEFKSNKNLIIEFNINIGICFRDIVFKTNKLHILLFKQTSLTNKSLKISFCFSISVATEGEQLSF